MKTENYAGQKADADYYRRALAVEKRRDTRTMNRLNRQAAEKGLDTKDLDTKYFRDNLKALEHLETRPGYTAMDYKRAIANEKRKKTLAKNKRKRR